MPGFEINNDGFKINGRDAFLICGEIHYFRMEPQYWPAALDALKEAGCNTVAFYIPWFVHEPEEGVFDFDGIRDRKYNLRAWLDLTRDKGLYAFVRPGPYIYAESANYGIPSWLPEKYENIRLMLYENGKLSSCGFEHYASHNHPAFIAAVERWYKEVCGVLSGYQAPDGHVVMIQACNEIPGEDTDDQNPENLGLGRPDGLHPSFLRGKYKTVENLNAAYGGAFKCFEAIAPHELKEKNEALAFTDHLEFYYNCYYPEYFKTLIRIFREYGITVPVVHNAYNPRAISLHYLNKRKNPELLVGVDCYYSLSGRLGLKEAAYYCEFGVEYLRSMVKNVPWVAEHESGYWNDYPQVYGEELYIWNVWAFAGGYRGVNLYLFAGGKNAPGMGFFGTDHNWQAPVNEKAEKQESFEYIKRSFNDINKNFDIFNAQREYDISLGIQNAAGLIWRPASREGAQTHYALSAAGFSPEICDFCAESVGSLKKHPALWVVSDGYMDEEVQHKLVTYVMAGGKLFIQGAFPCRDYAERQCNVLAEAVGIKAFPHTDKKLDGQKLSMDNTEHYLGRTVQAFSWDDAETLAYETCTGLPAVMRRNTGNGTVTFIAFNIEILFDSQVEYIKRILSREGVMPMISGLKRLRAVVRGCYAIILNLHPVEVRETAIIKGREFKLKLAPYSFKICGLE